MRIALRADASVVLGSGHVMRCLTLAETLRQQGDEVRFLCREEPGHMAGLIRRRGFACDLLSTEMTLAEDAAQSSAVLASGVDLLLVDHYRLDDRWESAMRSRAKALAVIDDLADRRHDCDLLLDQNLMPDMEQRYRGRVPIGCRLLLGPEYLLLREEFRRLAALTPERDGRLRRLLLFFGGSDPDDLTGRALDELDSLDPPLHGDVVIGSGNRQLARLRSRCEQSGGRWLLHVQTERMAELMAAADLTLGAGGSSHWERCLLGLPALVVTVAANQVLATRMLDERGACRWLGDVTELSGTPFRDAVSRYRFEPEALCRMSRIARAIVPPGDGVKKVAAALRALPESIMEEATR
jgi:UDP-2,4-diacetamido-2,4,6-trideoxy-beta-L-altropyranose hydrolase